MEGRDGDLRVPLISSLFCIFVLVGGVFLILYVFSPDLSKPWFPAAALLLIGSPWIFWLLTYLYTCIKACVRGRSRLDERQISRRSSSHGAPPRAGSISSHNPCAVRATPSDESAQTANSSNSPNGGGRHVHFGEVVVVEGEGSQGGRQGGDSSVNSNKEIEMPLNRSPPS